MIFYYFPVLVGDGCDVMLQLHLILRYFHVDQGSDLAALLFVHEARGPTLLDRSRVGELRRM